MGASWWHLLAPLLMVTAGALVLLAFALLGRTAASPALLRWVAILSLLTGSVLLCLNRDLPVREIMEGAYRWDPLTFGFTLVLFFSVIATLALSFRESFRAEAEWFFMLLCAALGACLAVGAADFLALVVGLELFALSTYILVGLQKHGVAGREAAWKYLVAGGVGSAFLLYGISFIVGIAGVTRFADLQKYVALMIQMGQGQWILLSFLLVFLGIGIKLALVPLHLWAPDVYRGSRSTVLSWLLVVTKITLVGVLLRLILSLYLPTWLEGERTGELLTLCIYLFAILTIVLGSVASLWQRNARAAFAYASLAQSGYLLIPFLAGNPQLMLPVDPGAMSIMMYIVAYALAAYGILAVVEAVTKSSSLETVSSFAGLWYRAPYVALAMLLLLFSAAGLPLTAGFFAKWYLFSNLLTRWDLALPLLLATLFSYLAYFRFVRQIFFRKPLHSTPLTLPWSLSFVVVITLAATLVLGWVPNGVFSLLGSPDWVEAFVKPGR